MKCEGSAMRGDVLLGIVRASGDDASANALLQEFQRGYPIERLLPLLRSSQEHEVRAGVWIASEMGAEIHPLLNDCVGLLAHPERYVRFFALDCVLSAATNSDGAAIAAALRLIDDEDDAVRWKAMNFAANASHDQLVAGAACLSEDVRDNIEWLTTINAADAPAVQERLTSGSGLTRRVAVVAAVRTRDRDETALRSALHSFDEEIRSFAEERTGDAPP
jgi:hypothetical protein